MKQLLTYFPKLNSRQIEQFYQLEALYAYWNSKINLISRKDFGDFYLHHVLHSMAIARVITFSSGAHVLDVGTGGGFPGIPLSILFPKTQFYLLDSVGKKIKVVKKVASELGLDNVEALNMRIDNFSSSVDFVVSRAVAKMNIFYEWVSKKGKAENSHNFPNGIFYLKGGDVKEELRNFPKAQEFSISTYFSEGYFETKKIIYLPFSG
mgnify:CR=1 FL=1